MQHTNKLNSELYIFDVLNKNSNAQSDLENFVHGHNRRRRRRRYHPRCRRLRRHL